MMAHSRAELAEMHCRPRRGAEQALSVGEINELAALLPEWALSDDRKAISRSVRFKNFHETMAFVNALAWIAHAEDHHPDMEVGYGHCLMRFSTHDVGGLSLNDFICAARVDRLLGD
jgi:4a-hydroxytetrahydrobiopterin dehydratase